MKILQVGSGLHGSAGIEKYVVNLSSALAARGHSVSVSVTPGTPLAGQIGDGAIQIGVRNKFDLRALSAYLRLFRSSQFDVVHTHFNPDFLIVAYASKLTRKKPLVMTRHVALPWARIKARNFSMLYDCIIPVSEASRKRLLASGVSNQKMQVAKAGCPDLIPPEGNEDNRNSLGSGFNVGYFGRLAPEKGISVLLEAAKQFPPDLVLHIFGDGPFTEKVESAVSEQSNIHYHGFQSSVAKFMFAVQAVVIPSIWEEAFPYAALEAMSAGRAIVASNIGGLPELVEHETNGLLVPPGDAAALASALARLAQNPATTQHMGQEGKAIHQAEYTLERMAERIEAVYRTSLKVEGERWTAD